MSTGTVLGRQQETQEGVDLQSSFAPLVAGVTYLLMLLAVWGIFATTSGMGWETFFTVTSEASPGWRRFLYEPDPMRIQNATFFHLPYVLGQLVGLKGSFVPYQIVYAALWWARSFLSFLIVRRLIPGAALLPFCMGAMMLVHASDGETQWIGRIDQFGDFFWLLLSLYLFIRLLQTPLQKRTIIYTVLMLALQYMCLWTYEAPLFIILAAPVLIIPIIRPRSWRKVSSVSVAWYAVPVVYVYETWRRYYLNSSDHSYQSALLRKSFALKDVLSDWIFNIRYSISFWNWNPAVSPMSSLEIRLLALAAAAAFVLGGLILVRREMDIKPQIERRRAAWEMVTLGIVFVALSFPAFIVLAAARSPWRTHLLSGIGAGMVLGAMVVLLSEWFPRRRLRPYLAIMAATPIIWFCACRTIQHGGFHRAGWQQHLTGVKEILRAVRQVGDGTIVVMTNVPRSRDPFGDDYWFNFALRLAYPRTTVAGVFYYEGNSPGQGDNLALHGSEWQYTHGGLVQPMITSAPINKTIVLQFEQQGTATVAPTMPEFLCGGPCPIGYAPYSVIGNGPVAPEALRRYGPL